MRLVVSAFVTPDGVMEGPVSAVIDIDSVMSYSKGQPSVPRRFQPQVRAQV
jgi:hypothetical protein